MGAEWATTWGPAPLLDEVADQLAENRVEPVDAANVVAELERTIDSSARASLFADLGCCRLLVGDVPGAFACWRHAAASTHPAPAARAWYHLGRLHTELGLVDLARANLDAAEAARIEPFRSRAQLARAHLAVEAGEHETAMRVLAKLADDVLDHDTDHALLGRILLGLGDAAERLGLLERAIQALEAARSALDEPERSVASRALTQVLERGGMVGRAAEIAAELADGPPAIDVSATLDRVERLARDGRRGEASDLLTALERVPCGIEQRFRMVEVHVELGSVNEAIDELERLHRTDEPETRARATYLLGEIYAAYDLIDVAESFLSGVGAIRSGHWADRAALALGDLAQARGDTDRATQCWQQATASRSLSVAAGAQRRLSEAEPQERPGTPDPVTIEAVVSVGTAEAEAGIVIDPVAELLDESRPRLRSGPFAEAIEGEDPDGEPERSRPPTVWSEEPEGRSVEGPPARVWSTEEAARHEEQEPTTPIAEVAADVQPVAEPRVVTLRRRAARVAETPDVAATAGAVRSDSPVRAGPEGESAEPRVVRLARPAKVAPERPVVSAEPRVVRLARPAHPADAPRTSGGPDTPRTERDDEPRDRSVERSRRAGAFSRLT